MSLGPEAVEGRRALRRLFVALVFPDDVQAAVRRRFVAWQQEPTLRGARFAREFHVTLKFLGEIAEARHTDVADALGSAFLPVRPFSVSPGPLVAFPTASRASVLYGGIDAGRSALGECAHRTEEALAEIGFPDAGRDFVPHVTLCRFRRATRLTAWIVAENERIAAKDMGAFPPFEATALTLVRSELHPEGALYTRLVSYPLS